MNDETKIPEEQENAPETECDCSKATEDSEKGKEKSSCKDKKEKIKKELAETKKEVEALKTTLAETQDLLKEQNDKYLRMMAEYDNFRRRAKEEKDAVYGDASADILGAILPVLDNLERAAAANGDAESVRRGVEMTLAQFASALERLGVCEIECENFDPNLHNAVLHVEDDTKGENAIVEVLQKGYKKGDKIIRYAMVKVAN